MSSKCSYTLVKLLWLPVLDSSADSSCCCSRVECSARLLKLMTVRDSLLLCHADGHCGALRQKDLLSSDSTVLMVQSSHELWHYPIMFPW